MWTMKRRHQHIKAETLTEYLDGRIGGPTVARLDQQLAACGVCRDELESLRTTVMLLRELPVEASGRSFTMAAPPPEPVRSRSSPQVRVPQWVYAGAASMAAIILAVLVTADATGLLAPDEPTAAGELAAAPATIRATEVDEASSKDSPQAAPALEAAAPVAMEDTGPPADDELSQPPQAAMAAAESASAPEEAPTATGMEAGDAAPQIELSEPESASKAEPPESRTRVSSPEVEAQPPVTVPETSRVPVSTEKGTALFWRLLEGIAGALGLVFLAAFAIKWKISRQTGST